MEDKRPPGRLAGSKVSQIANIFQSMSPLKNIDADVLLSPPPRFNSGKGLPHEQVSPYNERTTKSPLIISNFYFFLAKWGDAVSTLVPFIPIASPNIKYLSVQ